MYCLTYCVFIKVLFWNLYHNKQYWTFPIYIMSFHFNIFIQSKLKWKGCHSSNIKYKYFSFFKKLPNCFCLFNREISRTNYEIKLDIILETLQQDNTWEIVITFQIYQMEKIFSKYFEGIYLKLEKKCQILENDCQQDLFSLKNL